MSTTTYNRTLHVLAWLTALATFPLIWMGGLVTSHGVGLAVPDWPNSFGYNMFLLPWDLWKQWGVFYEHTHRLLGTVVGFFAILLTACAWFSKNTTRAQRWLALTVLLAVIFQGILGGLRVVWVSLDLAIVHGIFAQMALCLMGLMIVISSRWWMTAPVAGERRAGEEHPGSGLKGEDGPALRWLAVIGVVLLLAQLMVAAFMRHHQAGLAIPDLPLHYGQLLPPTTSAGLDAANAARMAEDAASPEPVLGLVTLGQIWLHFGHRLGAVLVTIALVWLAVRVLRRIPGHAGLAVPSIGILVLLAIQLTLGVLTVYWRKPADIASLHVAAGALLLLVTFVLTVRIFRIFHPHRDTERHGFPVVDSPAPLGARPLVS